MAVDTGGSNNEVMRLDSSGNVLVGTTDSTVYANGDSSDEGIVLRNGEVIDIARKGDLQLTLNRQTNDGPHIAFYRSGGVKSYISTRNNALCFDVNSTTERLRIASNGDIGLGTVPETDGQAGSLYFSGGNANIWGSGNANLYTAVNARYTGGGGWKYNNNGLASYTAQQSGTYEFRNAPSGTADNVATFTTRFQI